MSRVPGIAARAALPPLARRSRGKGPRRVGLSVLPPLPWRSRGKGPRRVGLSVLPPLPWRSRGRGLGRGGLLISILLWIKSFHAPAERELLLFCLSKREVTKRKRHPTSPPACGRSPAVLAGSGPPNNSARFNQTPRFLRSLPLHAVGRVGEGCFGLKQSVFPPPLAPLLGGFEGAREIKRSIKNSIKSQLQAAGKVDV